MDHVDRVPTAPELHTAIAQAREFAREQVYAAWQLHVDRVREQLETGWREQIDQIFAERFSEVEARLRDNFEAAVDERSRGELDRSISLARTSSRRELTERLNLAARRLKQADTRQIWIQTLLDVATEFCDSVAVFAVQGSAIRFEGAQHGRDRRLGTDVAFPISSAPALANTIESLDTVVSLGSPGELSPAIADLLGTSPQQKVYLFPLVLREQCVGLLYAQPGESGVDVSALELTASLASGSIEAEPVPLKAPRPDLVRIATAEPAQPMPTPAPLSLLPQAEQEIHLRAQRFARTQVARLLLYKVQQVKTGRTSNTLYARLRDDIDAGRNAFKQQFVETCPSMLDYYHLELVQTLAANHSERLGPEYPGPLV